MTSLKKTLISGDAAEQLHIYEFPDFSSFTNYSSQAKPLLEQAKAAIEELSTNIQQLYKNQAKIVLNCENKIKQLQDQIKNEQDERQKCEQEHQEEMQQLEEAYKLENKKVKEESQQKVKEQTTIKENAIKLFEDRLEQIKEEYETKIADANKKLKEGMDREKKLEERIKTITSNNESNKETTQTATTSNQNRAILINEEASDNKSNLLTFKMTNCLQHFSGRQFENINDWLFTTNRILEMTPYTDREKTIIASNYLKDIALQEYILHEQTHGQIGWDEFKAFIKERFTPKNQSDIIRNKMSALKQLGNVKEYYIDFRKLANQLDDMSETDKIKSFTDGLRPSTAAWVRFNQKKTLDEAYQIAENFEAFGMQSTTLGNFFSALTTDNNTQPPKQTQQVPKCNYCQRLGHTIEICKTRIREQQRNPRNTQPANKPPFRKNNNQQTIQCIFCNKIGHVAENCWKAQTCTKCNDVGHIAAKCPANPTSTYSYMSACNEEEKFEDAIDIITWPAKVDGHEAIAALDSASHISIISQSLVEAWKIPISTTNKSIETSTGDRTKAIGQTETLLVEFEGTKAQICFTVTRIETFDILLGLDWFKQTGVLLDPKNEAFIIPERKISAKQEKIEQEFDIETELNLLTLNDEIIERDDYELVDDYTCFGTKENSIEEMKPIAHISEETKEKLENILRENKTAFATSPDQLGCCKEAEYEIETTSDMPIHNVPYRQSPLLKQKLEEEINDLLKAGIIKKGTAGTWSSPAFMIKQKGKYRMVVNYKKINSITKAYKHPQPRVDDHLDSFQGCKYFSQIDLRKGFYQLPLGNKTKHKSGFVTPSGIYEFNRLPFGLTNGPAIFCSVMQNIFGDLNYVKCYIDDITIASKTEKEHLEHINAVIQRLNEHNLKMNPEKCKWFAQEIKVLGHIISHEGIKMDTEKIEAISSRKAPTNVKQLQTFLGMTNYYRRFIEKYSHIAAPLHKLTAPTSKWEWNEEHQLAFEQLKLKLTEYPILRPPDFNKQFILHTDASHVALGAILAQKDDNNHEYACIYASKLLKPIERTYGITELECLAIIWAINHLRTYLYGNKFTLFTDNQALKWLQGLKSPSARLTRWSILLSQFEFEVKHRSGKSHANADAISRPVLLTQDIATNELTDQSSKISDPYEDQPLLHYLKHAKHLPGVSRKQARRVERMAPLFKITKEEKILARKNPSLEFNLNVPKLEEREELVLREHELGHQKAGKVHANLSAKNIYWRNMYKTIEEIIAKCSVCLKYDKCKQINETAIATFIDNIFDKVSIDLVNALPLTTDGFSSILVIVEFLSKFAWAFPLKSKSAEEIASHLISFICVYGPPKCIISDQGKEFVNSIVNQLCQKMKIIRRTTSAYNPRANGECERTNQTLMKMLIKHCHDNPTSWTENLNIVLLAYRTTIHATTNKAPYELMFGRKFPLFDDWIENEKEKQKLAIEHREMQIRQLFEEKHNEAQKNIVKAQEKQTKTQDSRSNATHDQLKKGDEVYIKNCKLVKNKFEPPYEGPYFVKERNPTSGNYSLETKENQELQETFPRWKLKATEHHIENRVEETKQNAQTKNKKIKILHIQKIGRGSRIQIEYPDKTTEWVPGQSLEKQMIEKFLQEHKNSKAIKENPKKQENRINTASLLTSTLILLTMIVTTTLGQNINGEFKYCLTKELNRIVNPNLDCKVSFTQKQDTKDLIIDKEIQFPSNIYILSKNKYYANVVGHQCYMTKINIKNTRKWIFFSKRERSEHVVHLSRQECLMMIEAKRCNNNPMICNIDGCHFKPTIIDEDILFTDTSTDLFACSFHKKMVIAEKENSQIFFSTSSNCIFNDLYCNLHDSIVVWQGTANKCLYSKIHHGYNFTTPSSKPNKKIWDINNIIYSDNDDLTFQVTGETNECGVRLYKTTDELLLLIENDLKAQPHQHIEQANENSTFNRQHDINNMLLAENDAEKYRQWRKEQMNLELTLFKECSTLANLISIISKQEDSFNQIHDLNGNQIITYTKDRIVQIPICKRVYDINITDNVQKCYKDTPILFKIDNNTKEGFLTQNNFIKESSTEINCKLVNQFQILPGNKLILIRNATTARVHEISGVIFHNLSATTYMHSSINFDHHIEIISNYDINSNQYNDPNERNDINGEYYNLPNDEQYSEIQYQSSTITIIEDFSNKIEYLILNSTLIKKLAYIVATITLIYVIMTTTSIFKSKANHKRLKRVRFSPTTETLTVENQSTGTPINLIQPHILKLIETYSKSNNSINSII